MSTIQFSISEDDLRLLNEVRATLSIIASMGTNTKDQHCDQLIMQDLVTILDSAEQKLMSVQKAIQRI